MKRIKSKIKSAIRIPGNVTVMSLMAVILVCAAPALVSVIHEGMSEDMFIKTEFTPPDNIYAKFEWEETTPEDMIKTYSIVPTDGGFSILLDNPGASQYLKSMSIPGYFDVNTAGNITKILIDTGIPDSSIRMDGAYKEKWTPLNGTEPVLDVDGNRTGVYEFVPTAVQSVMMQSGNFSKLGFDISLSNVDPSERPAFFNISVEQYITHSVPIAEIIVGATGVLLLICAILATPWVSTSGLTVKRRRR